MTVPEFLENQSTGRKGILSSIHSIILEEDRTVLGEVGRMMGKEMILFKERGYMKYGLAGVKNYMTMHIMPIYGSVPLYTKYQKLLPDTEFQKGCINFRTAADVPLEILHRLFADCAKISIALMLENRKK
jgi:hypothetical protein